MRLSSLLAFLLLAVLAFASAPKVCAQDEPATEEPQTESSPERAKTSAENKARQQDSARTARSTGPLAAYKLEYLVTELEDGKKTNSRSYSLLARTGSMNRLRIGGRLPVGSGAAQGNMPPQFQYIDVGMNIDCTVEEQEGSLLLDTTVDVSSIAPQRDEQTHQPIVRQMRSNLVSLLAPGKPTIVTTMDDPTGKARFQIEVTASKVK